MSEHRHLDDEALLQALLEPALEARRAIDACALCAQRARELELDVAELRELVELDEQRDAGGVDRLAQRVLDATTRQRAPHGAPWLKVAAAITVVCLGAWALDAWKHSSGSTPEHTVASHAPSPAQPTAAIDADTPCSNERVLRSAPTRDAGTQALRTAAVPNIDGAAPSNHLARLLWARSRQIRGENLPSELEGFVPWEQPTREELALWIELALDRWALTGQCPQRLDEATDLLLREPDRTLSRLELYALDRAARYGALDDGELDEVRALESTTAKATPTARAQATRPLGSAWFDALRDAAASTDSEDEPVVRAWLAFAR